MANYRYGKRKTTKKKTSNRELKKLAFQLGRIDKGLKNPNSQVFDSYSRGLGKIKPKTKKPLI